MPHKVATLDRRGIVGWVYIEHLALQHAKIFNKHSHKSMGATDHQGLASLDPRDMIGRIKVVIYRGPLDIVTY